MKSTVVAWKNPAIASPPVLLGSLLLAALSCGAIGLWLTEDAQFGEIWACLPDGTDRDLSSDGCVAMLSVSDPSAEPTGFIFDGTGRAAFYIAQHGQQPAGLLDFTSNPIDGQTDDLIKITGFTKP